MEKKKVIVYVDGYNFYYGLKHGGTKWKRLYWLDIAKFFERMMLPDQDLVEVNYYSARPLDDQQAADNQDILFSANLLNSKFKLHCVCATDSEVICISQQVRQCGMARTL